ncbi:MAG: ELM1/GtrOC1 family putative glycosyltransferase, partial [Candidatus Omnitrophota bacterium]
ASMHKGAFEFALKTDSTILPAFMIREKGPYHRLEILKPIHIDPRDLDRPLQIKNGMQVFAGILQSFVSRYPEQWLWLHKRWKSTPARTVVVLNDGKAGHLNQSLGVARIIQKYRQDRGYVSGDTKLEVIDVKYKSGFHRFLFSLCGMFASGACQGCMRCVRFCLEPGSAKKLLHAYADIVISCGSSLAPVNLCLSKENDARSVCIMKPGRLSLKRFSLAVIPKHDGIRPRKNIVVTDGSPNIVDPETMLADSKRMEKLTGSSTRRKIGILLGGNNPDYKMEPDLIKKIADEIEAVAERLDLEIMITTSRRTPRSVDNFLKERFGRSKRCRSLVIANENNVKGAVGGILGLCDVVVVSGDSSSMISEAASSGKHTLVFLLDKRGRKKTKHDALIKNLSRQGCLAVAGPDSMADAVEGLITNGSRGPKGLGDKEKIYKAVGALF